MYILFQVAVTAIFVCRLRTFEHLQIVKSLLCMILHVAKDVRDICIYGEIKGNYE